MEDKNRAIAPTYSAGRKKGGTPEKFEMIDGVIHKIKMMPKDGRFPNAYVFMEQEIVFKQAWEANKKDYPSLASFVTAAVLEKIERLGFDLPDVETLCVESKTPIGVLSGEGGEA